MSRVEVRGVIVPSNYDSGWTKDYIEKGIIAPESYIRRQIAAADREKPMDVYVNSPGGSVFAAYEVINALTEWRMANKQPVHMTIGAMAASAAAAIAVLSGAKLRLHRNSKMMFHGAWTETTGGSEAHEDTAKLLEQINADLKTQLVSRFGVDPELVDLWFSEGRAGWLSANDAMEYNMAEAIIDEDDMDIEFADEDVAGVGAKGLDIAAFASAKVVAEAVVDVAEIVDEIEPKQEEQPAEEKTASEPEQADDGGESADAPSDGGGTEEPEPAADDGKEQPAEEQPEPEVEPDAAAVAEDASPEESIEEPTDIDHSKRAEELAALMLQDRLAEHLDEMAKLVKDRDSKEQARRKAQGGWDSEIAGRAKDNKHFEERIAEMQAALENANARLVRLTLGSLSFSPTIESWEEALKASDGDYVKARKQYPDAYASFMQKQNTRR